MLGLERTQAILDDTRQNLPPAKRKELDEVIDFTALARDNLSFSDDVLNVVGEPIKVSATSLKGGSTSLDEFAVALAAAVSLMFITLLLAAGMLAHRARGERVRAAGARPGVERRRCSPRRPAWRRSARRRCAC